MSSIFGQFNAMVDVTKQRIVIEIKEYIVRFNISVYDATSAQCNVSKS